MDKEIEVTARSTSGSEVRFAGIETSHTSHDCMMVERELELLVGGTWTATAEPKPSFEDAEHFAGMARALAETARVVVH